MSGNDVVGWHWLILETGANQAYIFASNRQAVNVGASELITRLAGWVEAAAGEPGETVPVVLASGKALVLVRTPRAGTALIREVTTTALREAPGLEVWGFVDPEPIRTEAETAESLARALRLHAAWRSRRPGVGLRHPTLPFTQPCRYSGLPAVALGWDGEAIRPRSAAVDLAWRNCARARRKLAEQLGDAAIVRPDRINDGVTNAGWVAVVHADGNGIGEIFRRLGEVYPGREYLSRLSSFSSALDVVTRSALKAAVGRVERERQPDSGWLLPLVLGGDDVTAVVDARYAFTLTVAFIEEFAERSAREPAVTEVLRDITSTEDATGVGSAGGTESTFVGLTACAGIAYVKPHHSFAEAYQLVDALCTSAKRVKRVAATCGALDFHVLHDSVGSDLDRARNPLRVQAQPSGGELRLWAGPIAIPAPGTSAPFHPWIDAHHHDRLVSALAGLRPRPGWQPLLSRTQAHQLREALTRGGWMAERARHRVLAVAAAGAADPGAVAGYLDEHLITDEPGADQAGAGEAGAGEAGADQPGVRFSRLVSAIDLWDVSEGTTMGQERDRSSGAGAHVAGVR